MPVQVNELVIRAIVDGESGQPPVDQPAQQTAEIVNECVEQVLEILKNREER
jgi:2,3-bisphosphoglycerate-independent phosphoglycerate mutase